METRLRTISTPGYNIHIGEDALGQLNSFLRSNSFSSVFILVDENTARDCLPILLNGVKKLSGAGVIELQSGEKNKNVEVCTQVWRVLGELGADRRSLLINLGGGVLSDLGGFVASTFKRGIAFVNIPTTLLAQVDASVGGKTGVDLDGLKNEVGLFADPQEVYICPFFLRTLSKREMMSGFAEILKHALISDSDLWEKLKAVSFADYSGLEEIIFRSVSIKWNIVDSDPFEKGPRKALNFGHTIGHALETFFLERAQSTLLHGEAVAAGMIGEAWLSVQLGGLSESELEEITSVLLRFYTLPSTDTMTDHRLLELMRHDKKNNDNRMNFVLLQGIGKVVVDKKVAPMQVIEALNYYRDCVKHVGAN